MTGTLADRLTEAATGQHSRNAVRYRELLRCRKGDAELAELADLARLLRKSPDVVERDAGIVREVEMLMELAERLPSEIEVGDANRAVIESNAARIKKIAAINAEHVKLVAHADSMNGLVRQATVARCDANRLLAANPLLFG